MMLQMYKLILITQPNCYLNIVNRDHKARTLVKESVPKNSFGLQVGILFGYVINAWASLLWVQIVMTYDRCTRIAAVKYFQQFA